MSSSYSPVWLRLLQKRCKFLFTVCEQGNFHWFWETECLCGVGFNGQDEAALLDGLRWKLYNLGFYLFGKVSRVWVQLGKRLW